MSLNWLLFKKSFASQWRRLTLTSVAVGLGVLILLLFTAVFHGMSNQGNHSNWRTAIYQQQGKAASGQDISIPGIDPLYATLSPRNNLNQWRDQSIWVVSFYASGAKAPHLESLPTPKPGQYYLSPALQEIINNHPDNPIGQRFGSHLIGLIPGQYLSSPDELTVIRGMDETEAKAEQATPVYRLTPPDPAAAGNTIVYSVVYLGVFILLFPIILFISIATQLGSTQREQRYAALRLVGATRRQITQTIAFESLLASISGIIVAALAYTVTLPLAQQFRLDNQRYWPTDIYVPLSQYALIIVSTLLLVLVANWWGMRHVQLSPLNVSRRQILDKQSKWWRVIPLILGFLLLVYLRLTTPKDAADQNTLLLIILSVIVIMIGLVLAGPWFTQKINRIVANRTSNAVTLLGTKYVSMHSTKVFRSVSGVVVALFAASFYLTATSGISGLEATLRQDSRFAQLHQDAATISSQQLPTTFAAQLKTQPYISSILSGEIIAGDVAILPCRSLASYADINCPDNKMIGINFNDSSKSPVYYGLNIEDIRHQLQTAQGIDKTTINTSEPFFIVKLRNAQDIDALRTFVAIQTGSSSANSTYVVSGYYAQQPKLDSVISELANLAYAGLVVTMLIAIASLLVSTVGAMWERRRSLMTLRLGGMEITQMKHMVIIESLIPLVATSIVAAGIGIGAGFIFMQMVSTTLDAVVTPLYLVIVLGSLAVATLGIYQVLPLLNRITNLENSRDE